MGWSIDDPRLRTVTPVQWEYYIRNIVEDEIEQLELLRDLVEYGAMFWNSEAVKKVRETRKNAKTSTDSLDNLMDAVRNGEFDS